MPQKNIGFIGIFTSIAPWKIKFTKLIDYCFGTMIVWCLPQKKTFNKKLGTLNKILVVRPGGIGDAIFLLPLLKKIQEKNSSIKIDILCEKRNSQIFQSQKHICHHIFEYNSIKSLFKLSQNKYDCIIDSEQWHYLSAIVGYFLKSEHTIGFSTRNLRKKLFNIPVEYQTSTHELSNFKNLFKPILNDTASITSINSCYTLPKDVIIKVQENLKNPYISLYIGASIPLRRFTLEQCTQIIREAFRKNYSVVLVGGKDVLNLGQSIEIQINNKRLINKIGKSSLDQTASIIKESKLFIGTDSGIMHLACAVGTPVIAVFGPGNLNKWKPIGGMHTIITENLKCSPCTNFGYTNPTCTENYQCMNNINIQNICKEIK